MGVGGDDCFLFVLDGGEYGICLFFECVEEVGVVVVYYVEYGIDVLGEGEGYVCGDGGYVKVF